MNFLKYFLPPRDAISVLGLIGLILCTLKLTGLIDWSASTVISPLIAEMSIRLVWDLFGRRC